VLAVGSDGSMLLWNSVTGKAERNEVVSTRELDSAAFSPDGGRYAVSGKDGAIRVYSVAGGPPLAVVRGQPSRVFDLGFGPDNRVVSAGDDGTARVWDVGDSESWVEPPTAYNIAFSPDGRFIASASSDGSVRVRDATTGQIRMQLSGTPGYTTARFSPRSDELVIARDVGSTVLTWQLPDGAPKVVAHLPKGSGMNVARFDATGQRIVYADAHGAIWVQDLRTGRRILLQGAPHDVWDVAASPDGNHVAAATSIGKVFVWRLDRPNRPERVLVGHDGDINAIAYSPDGQIVTAGSDRTVRIWNPSTGARIVLHGHQDEANTAIFSSNGSKVLSVSSDGTLRLWDARSGDALAVLESGGGPLNDVTIGRGWQIATLSGTGVVRVFKCDVCGTLAQVQAVARSRAAQ
jgi:WD40 repeat protein